MAIKRLTARLVETASHDCAGKRTELRDKLERGLKLRITPTGRKSWALQYTRDRKNKTITLGPYPQYSLDDARRWAREVKADVARDKDPALSAQEEKQARKVAQTFQDLADEWLERYARPNKKKLSVKDDESMLKRHILPELGHVKASDISKRDVIRLLDNMMAKADSRSLGTGETRRMSHRPNRVFALLRTIFKWAVERDILESDPMTGVKRPIKKEPPRERVLTQSEIRHLWKLLERTDGQRGIQNSSALPMSRAVAKAIQLSLVTAQRIGEVLSIRLDQLSLSGQTPKWTIPGSVTKNGQPHIVPLSPLAASLIIQVWSTDTDCQWLFPNPKGDGPIDPHAATKGINRSGDKLSIDDFRIHDLRRTAATYMAESGISEYTIGLVLNHQTTRRGTVTGRVYNQYSYDREKRGALLKWESRLKGFLKEKCDLDKASELALLR